MSHRPRNAPAFSWYAALSTLVAAAPISCAVSGPRTDVGSAPVPAPPSPAAAASPATSASSAPSPQPAAISSAPPSIEVRLSREVEGEVFAIALEKPPHAAALGPRQIWISDANGWRSEALPDALTKQPAPHLSVFFGRDYRVRVVGTRLANDAAEGLYFRWLPGGLRVERAEIGRLGTPSGALVAVLGTADPEIVCRPGEICLVKSRRGWQTIKAPERIEHITLGDGVGWAVAGTSLLRLGATGWEVVAQPGTWQSADGLFAARDVVWVIESGADRLHTFDGARFVVSPSPVQRPRALWGARADALWLVGDGGLAHFDGRRWLRAEDAPGPLSAVAGRSADDVWVGGKRGLFRVVAKP